VFVVDGVAVEEEVVVFVGAIPESSELVDFVGDLEGGSSAIVPVDESCEFES
jgi:hypothetical protein